MPTTALRHSDYWRPVWKKGKTSFAKPFCIEGRLATKIRSRKVKVKSEVESELVGICYISNFAANRTYCTQIKGHRHEFRIESFNRCANNGKPGRGV